MDDNRNIIIKDSNRIISKVQLLSVFFEEELIFKIYVRTQVIQKIFENNPELDITKLQLFHLQFTETIIELLKKIKQNNEKSVCLAEDEIALNEDLVHKISATMRLEEDFGTATQTQTKLINESLFKLYQNLSDLSSEAPFSKNISQFSLLFSKDFFHEIDNVLADELTCFDMEKMYKNGYGMIDKRLMGLQCKYGFNNTFYCGLKSGSVWLEVYKLNMETVVYFIFQAAKKLFVSIPFAKIESINLSDGISKKAKIIQELTAKNILLRNNMNTVKTSIPDNVLQLLTDYFNKISALNFLDFIDDFDVQANILKAMLNTESL